MNCINFEVRLPWHQGGRFETVSALYHFRNRDYSASLGRWIQIDPWGTSGGDANFYRAYANQPVNALDPLGLIKVDSRVTVVNITGNNASNYGILDFVKLAGNKNNTIVRMVGWEVVEKDEGGCVYKCQVNIAQYAFSLDQKGFDFFASFKPTGISQIDSFVAKLPEKLRELKLEGSVTRVKELSLSHSVALEGRCKDIKIDDVKKVLNFSRAEALYKEADERREKPKPGDDVRILNYQLLNFFFESVRE